MRICVGKRGLPCLFRKWLRTEGTWRIRGIPLDGWELWGGGWSDGTGCHDLCFLNVEL